MFYASDLITQYLPWYYITAGYLHSFQLPHWVPNIYGAGYPLLAEGQTGALSPVNLLILFAFPFKLAVNLLYVTYFLIAVGGVYWFLRINHLGKISSLLGGLVFSLSGFMVSRYFQPDIIFTSSLMPWGLAIIQKSTVSKRIAFALAPLIYLQITAGHLQMTVISILAYLTFGSTLVFLQGKNLAILLKTLLIIILGIGMAAAQIVPSLKLFELSQRKGWDPMIRFTYSLPHSHLITYLNPAAFGISAPGDNLGFSQFGGSFWEFNLTIWTLPFLLSLVALATIFKSRPNKTVGTLCIIWASFLLLSFGGYFKPYWIVAHIPDFPFRAPSRFLLVATFAASALAAFGFEKLFARQHPKIRGLVFSLVICSIVIQETWLFKNYILTASGDKIVNSFHDLSAYNFTTALPLDPNIPTEKLFSGQKNVFREEFQKGLAISAASTALLFLWYRSGLKFLSNDQRLFAKNKMQGRKL